MYKLYINGQNEKHEKEKRESITILQYPDKSTKGDNDAKKEYQTLGVIRINSLSIS